MTTSNARKINIEKNITMTRRVARKNNLFAQKLAGMAVLVLIAVSLVSGGDMAASVVLAPMALVSVFSKEKVLDFGIFSSKVSYYK